MDPTFLREVQARKVRGDRIKLALMVVALVVLIAAMVRLTQHWGSGPSTEG